MAITSLLPLIVFGMAIPGVFSPSEPSGGLR